MKQIIIIRENNQNIPKIKDLLEREHINYEIQNLPKGNNKKTEENIFAKYGEATKDKQREQEAKELENAEEEDIVNEEW